MRDTCPRCAASLDDAARSLFALRPELGPERSSGAKYTAYLMRRALIGTGRFRERKRPAD